MAHTRLLLVRHAATAANLDGRYVSRTDPPLHADGLAQAKRLGEWLAAETIHTIIHSGSRRTAETLAAALGHRLQPWHSDSRWQELDYGAWEGLNYQELLAQFPAQARAHWADPWQIAPPDGETLTAVAERVQAASTALLEQYAGQSVLLVAHATPLQLLICSVLGTPTTHYWRWKLDLGSLSCIDIYSSGPIVNWLNRGYTPPPAC
jgi:2,3-bisphosphoglycerate-dependent phosphoglycerate mutase/probable phosphoglycerate mutase